MGRIPSDDFEKARPTLSAMRSEEFVEWLNMQASIPKDFEKVVREKVNGIRDRHYERAAFLLGKLTNETRKERGTKMTF